MSVTGFTAPGFEEVRKVFESRYAAGTEELGATCAVYHAGEVSGERSRFWRVTNTHHSYPRRQAKQ